MRIAVTGATGFLGRYIVNYLSGEGHSCRCWYRPESDRGGFEESTGDRLEWIKGELGDGASGEVLVQGTDAVVHAALHHPGGGFRGSEGELLTFVEKNILGSLQLIVAAQGAGVERFVFISTCAVHEVIRDDRPLDEAHPLWPMSHYGAHKAAIEKFVHSFGLQEGYQICALRPTGIYGLARPVEESKWFELVKQVARGKPVKNAHGGKEVHASDVAKAVGILLQADGTAGQAYNCYDMYIADQEVARIAKRLTGSKSTIADLNQGPKNQIVTDKIKALGMSFGGLKLLEQTIKQMLEQIK
ncbi:MAG: NAD(P)-dependent oxidoreductase [Planctomycetota bacterium]|nr:MAG: NAD(P)-dependent oxidoreductase [Planctomycetota bacterium]